MTQKPRLTQAEVAEYHSDDYNQTDDVNNGVQSFPPDVCANSLKTAPARPNQKLVRQQVGQDHALRTDVVNRDSPPRIA